MRAIKTATFICFFTGSILFASSISDTLKQTTKLMQNKQYKQAQQILLSALKENRHEYKLWLALGYVFEEEENYEKALKAFENASSLKTGIDGLQDRIIRLKSLIKNGNSTAKKEVSESQALFHRAKKLISKRQFEEGYLTFLQALELDRSLLASDDGIIEKGLRYFANVAKTSDNPENLYYLGSFLFFSGNYADSRVSLEDYISKVKISPNIESAKSKLGEIQLINAQQAALLENEKARAKENKKNVESTKDIKPAAKSADKKPVVEDAKEGKNEYKPPVYNDEYSGYDGEQLYQEALSLAATKPVKAIKLLSRSISAGNDRDDAYMLLGDLYAARKGFAKEAISAYQKIIENNPNSSLAKEARAKIIEMNPSNEQRAREVYDYFKR
ncbi:MAG: hypothetical protein Kow0029_06470 [Candidatus Rifleibacteriota bacterium]